MNIEKLSFSQKIETEVNKAKGLKDELKVEKAEILRNTLTLILSRPNKDNSLVDAMPIIKAPLDEQVIFEETLFSITNESLRAIQANELPADILSTYYFILENILSETRPCLTTKDTCKDIFNKIIKANIKVDTKVRSYRRMNGMFKTASPSLLAKKILQLEEKKRLKSTPQK